MFRRFIASVVCFTFIFNNFQYVHAQDFSINQLPAPGTMVGLSSPFAPLALKGIVVDLQKPLEFQFIVDTGKGPQNTTAIKEEANRLVKYFLAGLTIPEGDLWVNLSPYEKDRMAPEALGQTDLGRDLLAQDYILKQLTASLIYPEKDLGKEFWAKVYKKAQEQFGTTNIPVNTFNKVWILPDQAQVFENKNAAYVTKSTLKVMLDEDYLALQKHNTNVIPAQAGIQSQDNKTNTLGSQIVREIILPEIEKEVNTGTNFAPLRQIYQALILAKWYKETIQNGLLDAVYTNKKKVVGINVDDPAVKEQIYNRYLQAYKKGAFNYIKEDPMPDGQVVPRKYFSGGITQMGTFPLMRTHDGAMLSGSLEPGRGMFLLTVNCDVQNNLLRNSSPVVVTAPKPKVHPQQKQTVGNLRSISVIPNRMLSFKPSVKVERKFQELKSPSTIQPKRSFDFSKIIEADVKLYDHAMTSLGIAIGVIVSAVGYLIYKVVKKYFVQEKVTSQEITTIPNPAANQNREQQIAAPQALTRPGLEIQIITPSRPSRNYENPQPSTNLPLDFRRELENHIQQLGNAVDQGSKEALIRSFRPVSPQELPMPIPLSMLDQDGTDRDKVIHILENLQMMMDGTTEKTLYDFERAIDNSRDSVTRQALDHLDGLSDNELLGILTNGYVQKLGIEFNRILDDLTRQFHYVLSPSIYEQSLYVSDEINERYPRFPRYLKWLLTNNPSLENDSNLRQTLDRFHRRTHDIPAFPDMITGYSKAALFKSLYLNPELARRVLLFLAGNTAQHFRYAAEADVRREIQLELARSLSDDPFIEGEIIPDEGETFPAALALEASPQMAALPAPGMDKTESQRAALKNLTDSYTQFMARYREHQTAISKAEADLKELSEGLAEAKRENSRVIIDALQPAVEGFTSRLRRLNGKMPRLNQEKARYEEQINAIRSELGPSGGTNLYSLDPMSMAVVAVFTVMFGIPLYITKKILNHWYNTTAGKTLGMAASIGSLVAGYYTYLGSLSPEIEQLLTRSTNLVGTTSSVGADPIVLTFFIIWPVAILSGVYGGKIGKGLSHDRLYWKANSAFKKGNFDEAISLLNQAIELNPENANDYILLAESQRKNRLLDESIASYKKAIEIEPNNTTSYNNLGIVYIEKGNTAKAIEFYKRSIELNPNDPIVLSNLGRSLHGNGQLLEAARVLQRSQEIKPEASVTEELNQILRQTGEIQKSNKSVALSFFKTMLESVPSKSKWVKEDWYSDPEAWAQVGFWVGILAGGAYLWGAYQWNWWQMGAENVTTTRKWIAAVSTLGGGVLLGWGLPYVVGKIVDVFISTVRVLKFPLDYKKLQKVNQKSSDELSDNDLKAVAPIYARMSKEYLETIFRSWMEAGQEEKIARLFKFGKWDSDKKRLYGDIGEYKRVSRVAASKFATTVQEQQAIFDYIDKQKDKMAQKGVANAITLMKDIIPQVADTSRNKNEFFYWLGLITDLPKNILEQGQRQISAVFTDLREYDRAREDSFTKFGPLSNNQANSRVNAAIDGLKQRLERDGINYAAILKKILPDINKASRNVDEFIFWINEVMRFETQWFPSGNYMTLLQNLIAFEHAKEEAANKLSRSPQEKTQLYKAADSLRAELNSKKVDVNHSVLKDILPKVTEASRTLAEFLELVNVLRAFDKNMWGGTRSVLQAFNNHVAYKQARENAVAKFTQDEPTRQNFLTDIDNLRSQLVKKGFPQASDLLQSILPELTKTCRTKEEFVYWLGELIGLNVAVWQRGVQEVIKNFNDLAGFKQAKEMALEKLSANQQERDELAQAIDALKAKLEEKLPSSAGLFKDVILEILKDIGVLADPPHRLNDFKWYLGKTVDFEAQTWASGINQVLSGYQEIKEYIKKKRALFPKFTTNQEEQERLLAAWENIDKSSNFVKPSFISLLNNTFDKIANFATNPREFVFWMGTLSELHNEVLEVFCRDIETVFAYYKDKGKSRDFNHLPAVLNQYHKTYHQTVLITANLLDTLTDPSLDTAKRVEKMSQYLIEQKIVKLGAPQNLVGLRDFVSFEELIRVINERNIKDRGTEYNQEFQEMSGEETLRWFIQSDDRTYTPIKKALQKMGRDGVYSYYESQKPIYYRHFLEDATGLRPGFNRPGEKFRVAYSEKPISLSKQEESQVDPITDDVQELKQFVRYLRMEWPDFYNDLTKLRKNKTKERPLEEFVTADSIIVLAKQLYDEVLKSQLSDPQKIDFVSKIIEINAFQETADLRAKILKATNNEDRLRAISQYWEKVFELMKQHNWIKKNSKIFADVSKEIKQRGVAINNQIGDGAKGIMQFYLSGGTLADFFKGWVSEDCTRFISGDHPHFLDTQAFVMDPAFFLFKVVEKNEWIGNVYSFIFKDKNGKFYLYVDMFQLNGSHPIAKTDSDKQAQRIEFSSRFIRELSSYLGSIGVDYLLVSTSPAQRGIGSDIVAAIKRDYKIENTETLSLRKLGGTEFFSDAGVYKEYDFTLGQDISNDFQNVSGYKIQIDKTSSKILLEEMASEASRLAGILLEKQKELREINQKGFDAVASDKNALALVFKEASEKKTDEIQNIKGKLNELQMKISEMKGGFAQAAARDSAQLSIRRFATRFVLATSLLFASAGLAQAAVFTHNIDGTLSATVEKNDTFGQILLDAGYKGPLWGTNGVVAKLSGNVESQLPSKNVNRIYPGNHFDIPNPHFSPETQQTINNINQQTESVQKELHDLRQANGDLNVQVSDLKAKLAQANKEIEQLKSGGQLPNEVAQLQNKKAEYDRQLADLEMKQAQAREELNRLTAERDKIKQEVTNLQKQQPGAQQEAKNLKAQAEQLKTQVGQLQNQATQLLSQKDNLEGDIKRLNQEKENLEKQLSDLRQKVSETQKVLDKTNTKTTPSFDHIWSSFSNWQQIIIDILALSGIGLIFAVLIMKKRIQIVEALNARVGSLRKSANALEAELESKRKQKEGLSEDLRNLLFPQIKEVNYEEIIAGLERKMKEYRQKIENLKQQRDGVRQTLGTLHNIPDFQSQNQELNNRLRNIEEDLRGLEEDVNALNIEKEKLIKKNLTYPKEIKELQEKGVSIDREIRELKEKPADAEANQTKLTQLNGEMEDIRNQIIGKQKEMEDAIPSEEVKSKIEKLIDAISHNFEALRLEIITAVNQQAVKIKEKELDALLKEKKSLEEDNNGRKEENKSLTEKLDETQKNLEAKAEELKRVQEANQQILIEEQNSLQEQVAAHQENIKAKINDLTKQFEGDKESRESAIRELTNEIAKVEATKDTYIKLREVMGGRYEKLDGFINDYEQKIIKLKELFATWEKRVKELETQVGAEEARADRVKKEIESIPPILEIAPAVERLEEQAKAVEKEAESIAPQEAVPEVVLQPPQERASKKLSETITLLSQDKVKRGIQDVIANSGKLTHKMEFFIYNESPNRLLQFKYSQEKLVLIQYTQGEGPKNYTVDIHDERIFDADGNVLIMALLKSKTAMIVDESGRRISLSSVLSKYEFPERVNPEVGGLVVKNSNKEVNVVELGHKGFVQINGMLKERGDPVPPFNFVVPIVHPGLRIDFDANGEFNGLKIDNLYDWMKSKYNNEQVVLGFHTHPDEYSSPRFSVGDLKEVQGQTMPPVLPLELVIGREKSSFFYHYIIGNTQQVGEENPKLDSLINETKDPQRKRLLSDFNEWLSSLSVLVLEGVKERQAMPLSYPELDKDKSDSLETGRGEVVLSDDFPSLLARTEIQERPSVLPAPYSAMIFDIDKTITDTTQPIDTEMLDELFSIWARNEHTQIALVSMQGIDEIREYIVNKIYSNPSEYDKKLLKNLIIYAAGGAQCFVFNTGGEMISEPIYDLRKGTILGSEDGQSQVEQAIIEALGREVKVTNVKTDKPKRVGVITISKVSDRTVVMNQLKKLFKDKGWDLTPRLGGKSTIHVLVNGVNKAKAVQHFLRISSEYFGQEIPPDRIIFFGDSFYKGGLDADVIGVLPKGAKIYSVGNKPRDVEEWKGLRDLGVSFSEDEVNLKNTQAVKAILSSSRRSYEEEKPKKVEPADELILQAREAAANTPSLYLSPEQRSRSIETFVSLVRQESRTGKEGSIREQLKNILEGMGAKVVQEVESNQGPGVPKNLVVEFSATGEFVKEKGIIVNAHMDTITGSTPEDLRFSVPKEQFFHATEGSFGADDKVGVTVILESLRYLQEKVWSHKNHRRIVFIITAQEESGMIGAQYLTNNHRGIFRDVMFSLTADGPINYDVDNFDNKYVVDVTEDNANENPYNDIIEIVKKIGYAKNKTLVESPDGVGRGDYRFFPPEASSQLSIRPPYEGNHHDEKVKIKNLIDHVDFWIGLLGYFASDIPVPAEDRAQIVEETRPMGKEVEALLERLGPQGNTGIHAAVVEEIKNILGDVKFQIQEDEFRSPYTGAGKNLIVTIPSTPGMENVPKIILNAHMDIYEHGFDYVSSTGEKKRSATGALDDRAGVIAILSALRIINGRILKKNIPHGPIILIFTDKEEQGAIGSGNIKIKYQNNQGVIKGLFDNTDIVIVVDGPLLSRNDKDKPNDHQRNNPFVISRLLNVNEKSKIYKIIYDSVKLLNFRDYQEPRVPYADGIGDHWRFAEVFDTKLYRFVPVINLRAPYNDFDAQGKIAYHSLGEIADVENGLVPVAQWVAEIVTQFTKVDFAGSPKGKGMFTPDEHINVNAVISQAQREGRGELIWGNASGWRDGRAKFVNDIKGYIASLGRYPSVTIPKLGRIDIPDILSSSSIVLIEPRANAPPGLLVNNKNSYSVAHNGLAQNSIYIDQYSFNKFYSFEIAILFAHEAILLGAKRLATQKGIPWTEELAKEVVRLADEFEVQIVGKSDKGNGSRFDDRIQEILAFNSPEPKPVRRIINEPETFDVKPERSTSTIPPTHPYFGDPRRPQPKPQTESQVESRKDNSKPLLDFADAKDDISVGLRKLFLDGMLKTSASNLPAKLQDLPPKIANEINQAYALGKIDRAPLDPDYFVALTVFFSRLFPNHSNSLINYLRNLDIQIIDTGSLTFGGTLDGHTFFIQRSVFEYLLKRQISVDEIRQGIKDRDMQILVALCRVIIHEIGAAFYKTSHEANQELEKLFLGLLSKTSVTLPYRTQEEFRNINNTVDLNSLPRLDWAIDESLFLDQVVEIKFTRADMVGLFKEIDSKLINALYSPNQTFRNNAAQTLSMFRAVEGLPFLRELKEKEPGNQILVQSIKDLTNINAANNHLLKGGIDLNQIEVKRTGKTINVQFDQAQLNELTQGGFEGFTPVITNMTRIQNLLPLLGINESKEPEVLVKV